MENQILTDIVILLSFFGVWMLFCALTEKILDKRKPKGATKR
jgi:hypothetical protein